MLKKRCVAVFNRFIDFVGFNENVHAELKITKLPQQQRTTLVQSPSFAVIADRFAFFPRVLWRSTTVKKPKIGLEGADLRHFIVLAHDCR